MDIKELYSYFIKSSGVSIDTRSIASGNVFFAFKGDNFDGNKFNAQALDKGAILIVSDDESQRGVLGSKVFIVDNTLSALQTLATYHRKQLGTKIIALTGSNGKTTSKELLYKCMSEKYNCIATKGNLNNHIGVPLTLLTIKEEHDFAIVEMGANHKREIAFLCDIALPDYGFITNIGKAHLEGFGGVEGVKIGKSELYKHLALDEKLIFCDRSDAVLQSLLPDNSKVIFYDSKQFSISENKPYLTLNFQGESIHSNLTGSYNIGNIAAAISVAMYFGVNLCDCINAIHEYSPSNNRSQIEKIGSNQLILDAYNANPTSMSHAIENAIEIANEKLVLILGDMLELGEDSEFEHEKICKLVSEHKLTDVYYIGSYFSLMESKYPGKFYKNTMQAKEDIDFSKYNNSYILLKGSRGLGLENLLN